ncbi:MAG: NmrA family NAD(P)-binding protein [Cohnella sp.]|nr:NmrA family NAD(P)-binding protein [Cohnella sp.]
MSLRGTRVLVYGATGVQGNAVVRKLKEEGARIRVLIRDERKAKPFEEEGIEAFIGHLGDRESLRHASEGAERVFFHLPIEFDPDVLARFGRDAVDAAREAGVKLFVFNASSILPDADLLAYRGKQQVREYLKSSGLPYIVLKPTLYMNNLEGPWTMPGIVNGGIFAYPLGPDIPIAWISATDAAAYAVEALKSEHFAGSEFTMYGPENLTAVQVADLLSRRLGREVRFHAIPLDDFEAQFSTMIGPANARAITDTYRWSNSLRPSPLAIDDRQNAAQAFKITPTNFASFLESIDFTGDGK